MIYLDLFAGIGGFALGFKRAVWQFDKHYFSEIDKYAKKVYKRWFPEAVDLGDVRQVKGIKADLITFGFPCQDLSIAGKRAGLKGARSGLFYEATRIIRETRPSIFIFENVKGLLTSDDFERVLREIADIGLYECEWQLLNTSWVLPQNRERIYFIGHLGERGGRKVFPIGEDDEVCDEPDTHKKEIHNIAQTQTARQYSSWGGNFLQEITKDKPQGCRVYSPDGISTTIAGEAGGLGAKTGLYMIDDTSRKKGIVDKNESPTLRSEAHGNLPCVAVLTPDRPEKRQNGRRFKENGEPMFTLTGQDKHEISDGYKIRRLTPIECARLQGFPDDWCNELSDNQAYRCYGNAVTVDIVKLIGERLKL